MYFDTNLLGHQPSGPTVSIFIFISKILSVIRADFNIIFWKFVSPHEESSAIGRRQFRTLYLDIIHVKIQWTNTCFTVYAIPFRFNDKNICRYTSDNLYHI